MADEEAVRVPAEAVSNAERLKGLMALQRHDRDHGIVRVDCTSPGTVERLAEALYAVEYGTWSDAAGAGHNRWTWRGDGNDEETRDYWRRLARAGLASLQDGARP